MSEFFLELFSEEVPANLQKNARKNLIENFRDFFKKKSIDFNKEISFSTPNRILIFFSGIKPEIYQKEEEIRGPRTNATEKAIIGFLSSNNLTKSDLYKKETEKGNFYFIKKPAIKISVNDLLCKNIPTILDKISWKKSMKWGDHNLYWGRPIKSILAIFDKKVLDFKLDYLQGSNKTFTHKDLEENIKNFIDFKSYINFFKKKGIIIDQKKRKELIRNEINKLAYSKKVKVNLSETLLDEINNIVEKPKILVCEFDRRYLNIPEEILIITMQNHQKYFPTFDKKNRITNSFFVVADIKDSKGLVKLGNERVIEARLRDAEFFWNRNKSQNLVKQVTKLKNINYFKGLGSYFDKIQRMRKLNGIVSDELFISKEKAELSSSISKVDLVSDLVGEFPELQGIMGGYFAEEQGFDKDICLAIKEHYLPIGISGKLPKKPFSLALALTDKLDTLVGFFGIDNKPTSSKDPYALRRLALGLIRLIVENKKEFKVRDLINYSTLLYQEQSFKFINKDLQKELIEFLSDRFRYYMKEKEIRPDIIEAAIISYGIDNIIKVYKKAFMLNKIINQDIGKTVISCYKRASSILDHEIKNIEFELSETTDPGLFKNDFEKNLYKKILELRKYFTSAAKDENFEISLKNLAESKNEIFNFLHLTMISVLLVIEISLFVKTGIDSTPANLANSFPENSLLFNI